MRAQGLAAADADDAERILIPDMAVVRVGHRQDKTRVLKGIRGLRATALLRATESHAGQFREPLCVERRVALTRRRVAVEVRQLHREQRGLQRIEPEIATDDLMIIFRLHPVHADDLRLLEKRGVVGDDRTGIAERAEILCREKKLIVPKSPNVPTLLAAIGRAHRLRGVPRSPSIRTPAPGRAHRPCPPIARKGGRA